MQLQNKKIIVTGGTRGIGAATVKIYVKEGAEVVFCGTNEVRGKETETTVNSLGYPGHATYLNCNIASKEAVDEFFAKALEILGGELHVLANVAGVEANMAATDYTRRTPSSLWTLTFTAQSTQTRQHTRSSRQTALRALSSTTHPT